MNLKNIKKRNNGAAVLFAVCFFAYMMSYISRLPFSALLGSMAADKVIDKAGAGTVTSAYMICYGVGQLVFGRLASKISPTLCISLGLIGAGMANIGMACFSSYFIYLLLWAICGVCNSMLWPLLTRAFAEWLPDDKKYDAGVKVSLTIPLGSAFSLLICSAALKYIGNWRVCFLLCGGIVSASGLISLISFCSIRKYIEERKQAFNSNLEMITADGKAKAPIKIFLTSLAFLLPLAAIFNGTLRDSVSAWIPTVVSDLFMKDASFAAFVSVFVPLSSLLGSYIARAIDKYLKSEMKTTAILFATCGLCAGLLYALNDFNVYISVLLMSLIITATLGVNTMVVVIFPLRFSKSGGAGAVSGFLNCTCFFSSAAASALYGFAGDNFGWRFVFLIWATLGAVAAVLAFLAIKVPEKIKY